MKIEGHVVDASRHGHVADAHHDLVRDLFAVVRAVVVAGHFTADHQLLQSFFIDVLALHSIDVNTVPQDRDGVGKSQDLGKIVRDEDDRISFLADPVHVLVQLLTAFLGKRRGGLVDDQDLGLGVGGLDDLDQLSVLEVVGIDDRVCTDTAESIGIQKILCLLVHGCRILDAIVDEGIFFAEEDVLCDGQSGQSSHFLHDDRDAETVRADLVLDEDRLVFGAISFPSRIKVPLSFW